MPNIYLTVNNYNKEHSINPWRYIGSDQNDNDEYIGSSVDLNEDIDKMGKNAFTKIILEKFVSMPNRDLRFREAEYLKANNVKKDPTYYNLTDIYAPAGGKKGMKHSQKFPRSDAWKESRKGWIPSEETRKLWSEQRTGRKDSEETRALKSKKQMGRPATYGSLGYKHTEEEKLARSERMKKISNQIAFKERVSKQFAKTFNIKCPSGEVCQITNLKKWCETNNIHYGMLSRAANTSKSYKGFTVTKIITGNNNDSTN